MRNRKMAVYGIMLTIAFVGQIILTILFYDPAGNALRINIGWGVVWLSAVFGWLPIITFRRKGKVEGRSYIHTTVLVDSGIYAIVRHPQYLAGVLLNVGLSLITPQWGVHPSWAGCRNHHRSEYINGRAGLHREIWRRVPQLYGESPSP